MNASAGALEHLQRLEQIYRRSLVGDEAGEAAMGRIGDWVVASDGAMIVALPPSVAPGIGVAGARLSRMVERIRGAKRLVSAMADTKALRDWAGDPVWSGSPCRHCNGTGGSTCSMCNGEGESEHECPDCGDLHVGTCPTCDGTGKVTCGWCDETGVSDPEIAPGWALDFPVDRVKLARALDLLPTSGTVTCSRLDSTPTVLLLEGADGAWAAIAPLRTGSPEFEGATDGWPRFAMWEGMTA